MTLKSYLVRMVQEIEVKGYSEADAREVAIGIAAMDEMAPVIEVELISEAQQLISLEKQ